MKLRRMRKARSLNGTKTAIGYTVVDQGGGCRGSATPPPPPEMTCGFLIQLVFCKKNYVVYWC